MESNFNIKVKSPSPLVYITKAGEVKISSELELANRENLWGVQCGNIFVALKNSGFSDWQHAIHQEKVISPQWKISLPLEDDLGDCCVVMVLLPMIGSTAGIGLAKSRGVIMFTHLIC